MAMTGYEALANGIILQAVKHYRRALKCKKKNSASQSAAIDADSIERFFRSGWFSVLTNLDGEVLIQKLKEET